MSSQNSQIEANKAKRLEQLKVRLGRLTQDYTPFLNGFYGAHRTRNDVERSQAIAILTDLQQLRRAQRATLEGNSSPMQNLDMDLEDGCQLQSLPALR